MATNPESILDSVKKTLGFDADYTAFDVDITLFINSAFSTLREIGVGPTEGFLIEDNTKLWSDFTGDNALLLASVKPFIYLTVRLAFDPPATSFVITALEKQLEELKFRLNIIGETINPPSDPKPTLDDTQLAALEAAYEIEMGWLFGNGA
jgi:hypothetical protein